jgi:hypothetical protein
MGWDGNDGRGPALHFLLPAKYVPDEDSEICRPWTRSILAAKARKGLEKPSVAALAGPIGACRERLSPHEHVAQQG